MEPFRNDFVATIIVQDNVANDALSKITEVVETIKDTYIRVKKDYMQLLERGDSPGEEIPGILRIRRSDGDVYDTIFFGGDIDTEPHIEIIKQADIDTNPLIDESWIIFVYVDEPCIHNVYNNINTRAKNWSRIIIFSEIGITLQSLRRNDFCISTLNKCCSELAYIIGEIICAFMCFQFTSTGLDEFCTENTQQYRFMIHKDDPVCGERRIDNFAYVAQNLCNALNVFLILRFQPDRFDVNRMDVFVSELMRVIPPGAKFCCTDNSTLQMNHGLSATLIYF